MDSLIKIAEQTQAASHELSISSTDTRNKVLDTVSKLLIERMAEIVTANQLDCKNGETAGLNDQMLDRLLLTPGRIEGIASDVQTIKNLPDPVGEIIEENTLANGIALKKVRVPLGVLGSIYESRPNVTIDIACLAIKSGNAALLRGGKESINSNIVLTQILKDSLLFSDLPEAAVGLITSTDRSVVDDMLHLDQYIDLLVPRGGAGLIKHVYDTASMPVVAGGIGVCHAFIDEDSDPDKVIPIIINSKTQRPTVCNALDTVLVHKNADQTMIRNMISQLVTHEVEVRVDEQIMDYIQQHDPLIKTATEDDWGTEFLSLIISIKAVDSLQEAIKHIKNYGSGHTEAILSENKESQDAFTKTIDAAAVFVNASTRFTDGSQFGLGAEVGISTQKFHARGPLGLKELTSYKWIGIGDGQIRP